MSSGTRRSGRRFYPFGIPSPEPRTGFETEECKSQGGWLVAVQWFVAGPQQVNDLHQFRVFSIFLIFPRIPLSATGQFIFFVRNLFF